MLGHQDSDSTPATESAEITVGGGDFSITRRGVLAGAALAVPAVSMTAWTPAWAASGDSVTLTSANMQVRADGDSPVTATVNDAQGHPVSRVAVSFSGPAGSTFSSSPVVTDGAGQAVTQLDLHTPGATPGSSVLVSAVAGAASTSAAFTVLGSNLFVAGRGPYSNVLSLSELDFPSPVVDAVGSGLDNTVVSFASLLADGTVWTKGGNDYGQLGDGTTTSRSDWGPVPGLSGVSQITTTANSVLALLTDGSVRAWGRNSYGELGIGSTTTQLTPVAVPALSSGVTKLAAGAGHVLAVMSDGSLRAWGYNGFGQVGDGSTADRLTPVEVLASSAKARSVGAGVNSSYAILSDGSVMSWGRNEYGELAIGSTDDKWTPVSVPSLGSDVVQIAGTGYAAYALLSDGSVKSWGNNLDGQLGDGSGTDQMVPVPNQTTPVQVWGLTSGVEQIAAGERTGYALMSDGTVKAWGSNGIGEIGNGSGRNESVPVSVPLPSGWQVKRLGRNSSNAQTALVLTKTS